MRRIDRNSNSGTAASRRSHAGAAQILRPKSPTPHISGKHLLIQLADIATGLPTIINAARQVHRGGGGRAQLALAAGTPFGAMGEPKLPGWMMKPVTRDIDALGMDKDRLLFHREIGGVTAFDRAHPRLNP